ncbi:MAG: hypothetical protein U5L95_00665 [Candidatus Saccharibacteria bacterium]|nr:hypothetical protein [Candidatus Saccharibacteria bacterium]
MLSERLVSKGLDLSRFAQEEGTTISPDELADITVRHDNLASSILGEEDKMSDEELSQTAAELTKMIIKLTSNEGEE